ncbi:MAG: undecaprenyldiphospho-muramoylpentapeptide beta-N-acetylglucosaminyltransferase [Clostridiales bacterium]|nr:undecaprenyldiphospho-muramoylpentapeptide beta-N-acetylglucosaminyltransferase [Clostridiales bacterium]
MKKIILTGGGTAGHVTPNIALIPELQKAGFTIDYIGSRAGIESELIKQCGIPFHPISSGKLRRYLSVKNITDFFRVVQGLGDAFRLIRKIKPGIIFSKGGFVSVPVVIAGKLCGVPVIIHESDLTPGLANKIAIPFAARVCVSFPETLRYLPQKKAVMTGPPVRKNLLRGSREKGLALCGFSGEKPVLLVTGGSLGSVKINTALRTCLPALLPRFDIVHLCGKNNRDDAVAEKGYCQFDYLSDELPDVFTCCDLIVSRAGSNAIFEFLALKKPNLLIPLSKNASRGDQILNARSFEKSGFSKVLQEEELTEQSLAEAVDALYQNKDGYIAEMSKNALNNGVREIMGLINQLLA